MLLLGTYVYESNFYEFLKTYENHAWHGRNSIFCWHFEDMENVEMQINYEEKLKGYYRGIPHGDFCEGSKLFWKFNK